jgi:Delta3-Delta2-enoyl-CoA isomerase
LVTISAGEKKFATGFDLPWMMENIPLNGIEAYCKFQDLMAKMIQLPLPSLAIIQGHCYAGGIFLALVHDKIIMTTNPRFKICLSEIILGLILNSSLHILLKQTLSP